ncbi:hypothetical protein GCM10023149_02430 [Mucilaginibacter gynuensis]|uniref:Putative beta-lactamase-inhibitor-like PepSY-like domain-containing protein n=1 Tax=Mucilaginibacter gynuensis TaxID=1302236 RepID=A0ABP8FPR5_9SPHI
MKTFGKTLAVAIVAVAFNAAANAQSVPASKVPAPVKATFMKTYPTVTKVKWEMEKGNYEAGFVSQKQETSAVFTADGKMLESEVEIKTAALPAPVLAYVKDNYKGKSIKEAAKITKTGGEVNYEAEVAGKDLLFDSTGKFIEVAKD